MNDVILGGAGFIGSHISEALGKHHLVIDDMSNGKERNLSGFAELKQFDASSPDIPINDARVWNLAVKSLPYSLERPLSCFQENVAIVENLCELMRKDVFPELIHFSSSEVYGEGTDLEADSSLNNPRTTYAASKSAGDLLLLSYAELYGLNIRIIRPFNAYGEGQNEGTYAGVIPNTIRRILESKKPYVTGDGKQTRDFNYIDEVVEQAMYIASQPSTKGKVSVIGSGNALTINQVVDTIAKSMEYTGEIEHRSRRVAEVDNLIAKPTYGQSISFAGGIDKTIAWYTRWVS